MSDKMICVQNVNHSYGSVDVLKNVNLDIYQGEFLAIVGPSGCGKTTLLNLISEYEKPVSGNIKRNGALRMVYQQDGLFPWLTVTENIGLGLRHLKNKTEKMHQIEEAIQLIGLQGFENHYPHQLSGGMRQRVELARALSGESDILLMDEPFSALDYLTRLKMRNELVRFLKERPRTVVLVTHDIEEAAQLADRIIPLTTRPATIISEKKIHLEKPRALTHPEVVEAVHQLLITLNPENDASRHKSMLNEFTAEESR
ncbi:MAG: ABC transporter ATP-binding protein [Balneolaceae bacterium]|nr:ABC transporter ATP-binding protein [Balneolaceae bacterium]